MKTRYLMMFLSLLLCIGCAPPVQVTQLQSYKPTRDASVAIFTSPEKISRRYEEVAILTVKGISSDTEADLIEKLRLKATEIGVDGIVLNLAGTREINSGGVIVAGVIVSTSRLSMSATAIRFVDE